jgi:hypothetical protein
VKVVALAACAGERFHTRTKRAAVSSDIQKKNERSLSNIQTSSENFWPKRTEIQCCDSQKVIASAECKFKI